jgi:hypothetical protein
MKRAQERRAVAKCGDPVARRQNRRKFGARIGLIFNNRDPQSRRLRNSPSAGPFTVAATRLGGAQLHRSRQIEKVSPT